MKKALCALALLLLLTGCSSWLQNDYLSVEPHVEPAVPTDPMEDPVEETPVVSNRTELRREILSLVRGWTEQGTILVNNYRGDLDEDLNETVSYATKSDPIGAYAVDFADAELTGDETDGRIDLRVVFRRSAAEADAIIAMESPEEVLEQIYRALDNFESTLTLRIRNYKETDYTETLRTEAKDEAVFAALILDYCLSHPESVAELPVLSAELYPKEGDIRILELHFSYSNSRDVMRELLAKVNNNHLSSAASYVRSGGDATEKADLLFRYLVRSKQYRILGDEPSMPAYSLLEQKLAHPMSFSMVCHAILRDANTDCLMVSGTRNGEPTMWNLLKVDGEYYAIDLMAAVLQEETELRLLDTHDLEEGGYEWDRDQYPTVTTRPEEPTEEP